MITLHAADPNQVGSASSFEVLLGEPTQRAIIFSGIALPEIRVNHDEETYRNEVLVKLGVVVSTLHSATVEVGLASISNDETAFTFALESAVVEADPGTGELQLRVMTAARGEDTWIHRFGYQIVAHVVKVAARISGTIRVPREIIDFGQFPASEVASWFRVSANRVEPVSAGPGDSFAYERLIPLAWARFGEVRIDTANGFLDYTIDGAPFNVPLRVVCEGGVRMQSLSALIGQVSGPNPVLLRNFEPEVNGVDFAATRVVVR